MARLNRICMACQKKYSYCPDCSRADALKPAWSSEFCSESCKDLWLTLTRYNMGVHSKSEAKSIILELNLKPIDSYASCVQRDYAKVMAEDKKLKKNNRTKIKHVDEEINVEREIIESSFEENQYIIKMNAEIKEITEDEVVVEITPSKKAKKTSHEVVIKKGNE